MVKVGVVGATGYAGEELIEILLRNPKVEIASLSAIIDKDAEFSSLFPRFKNRISLICKNLNVDEVSSKSDLVFLALPHTVSMKIVPAFLKKGKRVIDLSADYRLPKDIYKEWYKTEHTDAENLAKAVYGLPELNRKKIKTAQLIANPGCYPTGAILALLPIIKDVKSSGKEIIIDSKSGVTGAGRKALTALSFAEVDEDFKCYKANEHQHMPEIEEILSTAAGSSIKVNFVPHLLPIRRGILGTIYVPSKDLPSENKIYDMYAEYFKQEPFVRLRPKGEMPQIKDVVYTNFCDIGIKVSRGMLIIVSVIDNLLKGASGQAVQNMNIMYGFDEKTALG